MIFRQLSLSKKFEDIRSIPWLFYHEPLETPDCTIKAEVPSLTLRTALSLIPFVSGRRGVDASCVQHLSSQARKNYCLCGLLLGFRSGGRNRCRRTMVPCFGLRLGNDNMSIRFVNKPCTTTAHPHCHLDSLSSVRMLWSAEVTSAKTVAAKCTVISGIKLTSALCSDILCYFAHVAIRIFRNMCEYVMFTRRLARI